MEKQTLSARDAASYLGISYWLLLELTKQKQLKHIKAGRKILFRIDSLNAWLNEQEEVSVQNSGDLQQKGRLRKIEI